MTQEQHDAIQRGETVTIETPLEFRVYNLIKGHDAKNFDGLPCNFAAGTTDGERLVMQEERINKETGRRRFSNWW